MASCWRSAWRHMTYVTFMTYMTLLAPSSVGFGESVAQERSSRRMGRSKAAEARRHEERKAAAVAQATAGPSTGSATPSPKDGAGPTKKAKAQPKWAVSRDEMRLEKDRRRHGKKTCTGEIIDAKEINTGFWVGTISLDRQCMGLSNEHLAANEFYDFKSNLPVQKDDVCCYHLEKELGKEKTNKHGVKKYHPTCLKAKIICKLRDDELREREKTHGYKRKYVATL